MAARGFEMAAWTLDMAAQAFDVATQAFDMAAQGFNMAAWRSKALACVLKPPPHRRFDGDMARAHSLAGLVSGLRNARSVGPRTVSDTFSPPDAPSVGDDYVPILTH